jgi:hypothetical protein
MKHTSDHHFPATSDHREKKKPGPVGGSKSDKPSHGATSSRIWVYPIMFGDKNSIPIWRNCHFGGIVILEYTNSVFQNLEELSLVHSVFFNLASNGDLTTIGSTTLSLYPNLAE